MNVAMRLLEKKKELPKKEKFLKKSLLEAKKSDRCVCRAGFCAGA